MASGCWLSVLDWEVMVLLAAVDEQLYTPRVTISILFPCPASAVQRRNDGVNRQFAAKNSAPACG